MILIFDFVEEFVKCDIHMKVRSCGSLCNVVKIGIKMSLSAQNPGRSTAMLLSGTILFIF